VTCPNCGLPLGRQPELPYTPPRTLTEQHEKYKDTELLTNTILDLPIEKANSIVNDALAIVELLPGKKNTVSDIRIIVELAIRIGNIASAYHKYLEDGGKHVPAFFTNKHQHNQEQTNEHSTKNGDGT
jgi:hypothetical protein